MIPEKERFVVDKKGKLTSVILDKKDYDKLLYYIEELEDVAAYDRAKKEKGASVPWNRIKR